MADYRYDDSARLETKVLLSDDRDLDFEERSDTELAIGADSFARARNRLKDGRRPSCEDTSDFAGGDSVLGTVKDELSNDVASKSVVGLDGSQVATTHRHGDRETLINTSKRVEPGPEIDDDGFVTEYEVALKYLGFGLFHVYLMIVNGIAFCSDAVEILSLSFVLPVLDKPDEFGISDAEGAVLSSVIFIGMLFGSYIWGSVADIAGRRTTLLLSLTCSGVFGLVSAFVPSFWLFTLMRFFSGFG